MMETGMDIIIVKLCLIYLTVCIFLVKGNTTITGYWTEWFDVDTPRVGVGDVETIENIEKQGLSVCEYRYLVYSAQCRTHDFDNWLEFQANDADIAPDRLFNPCTNTGLECRNVDQPMEATCRDYQIRFFCGIQGKDIITKDNSSMIALAAGLTFLFPIVLALLINLCKRYCVKKRTTQQPIVSNDSSEDHIDQSYFDPPPSYNCLFGNSPTTSSTEYLVATSSQDGEASSQNQPNQICIHTLPSSNMLPSVNSVTVTAEADNYYKQFRERLKRFPGMHLSVLETYNMYRDSNTTPPPSYNEALVILSTVPNKKDES